MISDHLTAKHPLKTTKQHQQLDTATCNRLQHHVLNQCQKHFIKKEGAAVWKVVATSGWLLSVQIYGLPKAHSHDVCKCLSVSFSQVKSHNSWAHVVFLAGLDHTSSK